MNWPHFTTEFAVAASNDIFRLIASEKLVKPVVNNALKADLLILESKDLYPDGGYIYSEAWITFFLSSPIINALQKPDQLEELYLVLRDFFAMFSTMYDGEENFTAAGSTFNFYFKLNEGDILMFPLHLQTVEILVERTNLILQTIAGILEGTNSITLDAMTKVYKQANKVYYLVFTGQYFEIKDPLQEVSDRFNKGYTERTDKRVSKPDFILHKDNLNKRFTFGNNWVLKFDGLHTMMIRPNDVSIYAGICSRHLTEAKIFYEQTIIPRHEKSYGNFPQMETQVKYFDYFELITTALIFSITAIEALVNSLIPEDYTFTTVSGRVKDKYVIERYASLFEKMRDHLSVIYKTSSPEQETWWPQFTALEELRNQTIHTKQHLSEERYSKLLEMEIFNTIAVYKDIIAFYGPYLRQDPSQMINEFPYGFGFDDVRPRLISDENYRKMYNNLHNPHNPL